NEPAACPAKIERPLGPSQFPHFHGAFAEYYYLRGRGAIFVVPDSLPDELVAPVNCALSQVIFGLGKAGLAFGDCVVIQGAGGLEPSLRVWGSKKIVVVIQYDPGVIPRALDFLVRNRARWPFDRLISHKYPLEKIDQAFADSEWHAKDTTSITRAALVP